MFVTSVTDDRDTKSICCYSIHYASHSSAYISMHSHVKLTSSHETDTHTLMLTSSGKHFLYIPCPSVLLPSFLHTARKKP